MASGAVVSRPVHGMAMSDEDIREILEYEKILQLRDEILAGAHPRLKMPPHLAGKLGSRSIPSPANAPPRRSTLEANAAQAITTKPNILVSTKPEEPNELHKFDVIDQG